MHRHFGAMHTSLSHLFYLEVTIQPYNFETMWKVGSVENKGTLTFNKKNNIIQRYLDIFGDGKEFCL